MKRIIFTILAGAMALSLTGCGGGGGGGGVGAATGSNPCVWDSGKWDKCKWQ